MFTRLPEKPEDLQQRENKYTVMAKLFYPDLSDAEYMHSLWNAMDTLEARATLRVLSRWYTSPGNAEVRPADVVLRDGTVVPQDRDFNHYKDDAHYGEIVRDMICLNWEIAKKCASDQQSVAGVVKNAQVRVFGPILNWYVTQLAAKRDSSVVENWPLNALNSLPDQVLLSRLLTAQRGRGDAWTRTCLVLRPFHATTNYNKRYSRAKSPVQLILDRKTKDLHDGESKAFWNDFRDHAEHRGLETARILLQAANVSEGYTALWERGRLDLTVEAVIHDNPKWHPLFTQEHLEICRKRLTDYGYLPPRECKQ